MLTFEDSVIAEITFDFLCVMLYTHIDKGVTLKKREREGTNWSLALMGLPVKRKPRERHYGKSILGNKFNRSFCVYLSLLPSVMPSRAHST